ncbi:sulfite exporter TauE/SafE family protein [Paenibacillus sp. HB172176]|uniref:sulfite exporter TauE/SafE family protein n=1 Tax=Paenibacillus sp. HB172176 TaxID=2493690 RepID=UPI00143A8C69|nr:sulfite exporter TauE/SafE family protein [Paenibacillus sp. HB172176]
MLTNWNGVALIILTGLFSAPHCIGMCGGIVSAVSMQTTVTARSSMLLYNGGRILSYTVMGAVMGTAGSFLDVAGKLAGVRGLASIIGGCFVLLWLWRRFQLPFIHKLTVLLHRGLVMRSGAGGRGRDGRSNRDRLAIAAVKAAEGTRDGEAEGVDGTHGGKAGGADGTRGNVSVTASDTLGSNAPPSKRSREALHLIVTGIAFGFMPCGLTYAMQMNAASSGSTMEGALIMALFGLSTFPALAAAASITAFASKKWRRLMYRAGTVTAIAVGVLSILRGLTASGVIPSVSPWLW